MICIVGNVVQQLLSLRSGTAPRSEFCVVSTAGEDAPFGFVWLLQQGIKIDILHMLTHMQHLD